MPAVCRVGTVPLCVCACACVHAHARSSDPHGVRSKAQVGASEAPERRPAVLDVAMLENVVDEGQVPQADHKASWLFLPSEAPGVAASHRPPSGWQCHIGFRKEVLVTVRQRERTCHVVPRFPPAIHTAPVLGVTCSGQKGRECVGSRGSRCLAYTCMSGQLACFAFTKSGSKALPFPRLATFQQVRPYVIAVTAVSNPVFDPCCLWVAVSDTASGL